MTTSFMQALSPWAESWSGQMWRPVWEGGLVFLAVWLVCHLSARIPAQARCWLWRIVIAKFLVTLVWVTPLSVPILPARITLSATGSLPATSALPATSGLLSPPESLASPPASSPAEEPTQPVERGNIQSRYQTLATKGAPVLKPAVAQPGLRSRPNLTPESCLFAFWLVGVMVGLGVLIHQWRSARILRRQSRSASDENLYALCNELAEQFGCKRLPHLRVTAELTSPVLVGLWHPILLLPCGLYESRQADKIALVLGHELAHLRRRDLVWNLLIRTAQLLFFFYPVVWWADRENRMAQEIACDEMAVSILNCRSAAYAEMLLHVVSTVEPSRPPSLAVGIGESFHNLKARLEALNGFCRRTRREMTVVAALAEVYRLLRPLFIIC